MSVDVEDYFQVSSFEKHIAKQTWDKLPCHVEANMDKILTLFAKHHVKATFFVLGWIAERYPQIVHRIIAGGHELASHGYDHTRVIHLSPDAFLEDIVRTKKILEDIGGQPVIGYRAPSYSINKNNLWAFTKLEEAGYKYSSSVYPIHHDLYGMPEAPRFSFYPEQCSLLEIPISTVQLMSMKLPCGGGGYFRLLPYFISKSAIKRVNRIDKKPCVFYFHPWEIDTNQPRQKNISLMTRFRHYINIDRMESRLSNLTQDFQWSSMASVFYHSNV